MNLANGKSPCASKADLRGVLSLLVFVTWLPLCAQPSAPRTFKVELNYQETDEALAYRAVNFKLRSNPFLKEPPLGRKDVLRGLLLFGERPDQATGFIWDKRNGRLHLDLNRNYDLTDDPQGTFASYSSDDSQSFTNVHWTLPGGAGKQAVRLELSFYAYRPLRVRGGICYFWQAKVSQDGADWQFGVVENEFRRKSSTPPKYLLVRPWSERERPLRLTTGTPALCDFTTNFFFGTRAYALRWRYESGGTAGKYHVTFNEQSPRMGELKVSGEGLYRLILTSRGTTLLVDQPEGTHKLPVGNYSLAEVWLRKGDLEAVATRAGRVRLDEQRPAVLALGGPLTNSVSLGSRDGALAINYKLLGVNNVSYRLARPDYDHPPQFAVFQGTNRLASGNFRYG